MVHLKYHRHIKRMILQDLLRNPLDQFPLLPQYQQILHHQIQWYLQQTISSHVFTISKYCPSLIFSFCSSQSLYLLVPRISLKFSRHSVSHRVFLHVLFHLPMYFFQFSLGKRFLCLVFTFRNSTYLKLRKGEHPWGGTQ